MFENRRLLPWNHKSVFVVLSNLCCGNESDITIRKLWLLSTPNQDADKEKFSLYIQANVTIVYNFVTPVERVYSPLIRIIFQEMSWFMCSLKQWNWALTSSIANPGLENANVITVILQVMETTQKREFHPRVQIKSIFPGPQSLPHALSSNISSVHHTLLEISLKFCLLEWHDAKIVFYGRRTTYHLLIHAPLLQCLTTTSKKIVLLWLLSLFFLLTSEHMLEARTSRANLPLSKSVQHLSGTMLGANMKHAFYLLLTHKWLCVTPWSDGAARNRSQKSWLHEALQLKKHLTLFFGEGSTIREQAEDLTKRRWLRAFSALSAHPSRYFHSRS